MSAPVMGARPTPGSVIASQALAAGVTKNIAAVIDNTAGFETHLTCVHAPTTAPSATSGVKQELYEVYGLTTLTNSPSAGGTSITVASATGLYLGMKIMVGDEIVTISAISGLTITIGALIRAHNSGNYVWIFAQTPTVVGPVLGQNLTTANSCYSGPALYIPTGEFVLVLTQNDASVATTVEATSRSITSVA